MKIRYSSNNSGGSWWLKDKDWLALEAGGWTVDWYKNQPRNKGFLDESGDTFLGAPATRASKEFDSIDDAIRDFEYLTGQDASDEGCDCCGQPHNFYKDYE